MTATKSSRIISRFRRVTNCSSTSSKPTTASLVEQASSSKKPENGLYGDIIKSAHGGRGNLGQPQIDFTLTDDGAKKFGEVTRNNIGHRLAIILDGEL
jgi:preprotein translocase subunit SecD